MSIEALDWAIRQTAGARGRKATLILVANIASQSGIVYAGVEYFAEKTECSRDTIIRDMAALEELGLLVRIKRRRKDGAPTSTLTVLAPGEDRGNLEDPEDDPVFGVDVVGWRRPKSQVADDPKSQSAEAQVADCPEPKSQDTTQHGQGLHGQGTRSGDTPEQQPLLDAPPARRPGYIVFDHWQQHMPGRQRAKLTPKRKTVIAARLKSFSVEDLCAVIDFIATSPWWNGQNDTGAIYNDLTTVFRSDEKVETRLIEARQRQTFGGQRPAQGRRPLTPKEERAARRKAARERLIENGNGDEG